MELLAPSFGLVIWTVLSFISLALIAFAIYRLGNNDHISFSQKLLWAMVILFVPILGAILYLKAIGKKHTKVTS
jgi:hypothetical protein